MCMLFSSTFIKVFDSAMNDSQYAIGYQENKKTDDGVNIITIVVQSVPLIIAFLSREKLKDKYTPIIKICINMNILSICTYTISKLVRSGILIGRLPIYFNVYSLILMPWVLKNSFEKKERRLVTFIMIICYLIYFYYQMEIAWNGWPYCSKVLDIFYY